MRKTTIGLLILAACGTPSDDDVDPPDANPPWNVTWTCPSGCPARDLSHTTTLAVVGLTLTYGGGPGGQTHTATGIDADGCLTVPREDRPIDMPQGARLAYALCPVGTGLEAMIQWVPSGGNWRMQAWR